ncbi:MAG: hypothetical protein ACKO3S_05330 [bacterium]
MPLRYPLLAVLLLVLTCSLAQAQACSPGTFCTGGAEPCSQCSPGFFQPSSGASSCIACSAGSFAPSSGSMFCNVCPPGTAAPYPGMIACNTCPDGSIAAGTGYASCTPCGAGLTSNASHTECVAVSTAIRARNWAQLKRLYHHR